VRDTAGERSREATVLLGAWCRTSRSAQNLPVDRPRGVRVWLRRREPFCRPDGPVPRTPLTRLQSATRGLYLPWEGKW